MRAWVKATLFFSSLSPLFVILLVLLIDFNYIHTLNWTGKWNDLDFITKIFTQPFVAILFLVLSIIPNVFLFGMIAYLNQSLRTKRP